MSNVGFRRRALNKEVDLNVLTEMRSRGLTNKQIANRLGYSVNTIYRYIGKMPKDLLSLAYQHSESTENALRVDIPYKQHEAPYEIPEAKPILQLTEEIREFQGKASFYKVNMTKREVELFGGFVTGTLRREDIGMLIDELYEIMRIMKEGTHK